VCLCVVEDPEPSQTGGELMAALSNGWLQVVDLIVVQHMPRHCLTAALEA
jgi:hypothetical protein